MIISFPWSHTHAHTRAHSVLSFSICFLSDASLRHACPHQICVQMTRSVFTHVLIAMFRVSRLHLSVESCPQRVLTKKEKKTTKKLNITTLKLKKIHKSTTWTDQLWNWVSTTGLWRFFCKFLLPCASAQSYNLGSTQMAKTINLCYMTFSCFNVSLVSKLEVDELDEGQCASSIFFSQPHLVFIVSWCISVTEATFMLSIKDRLIFRKKKKD